MSPVVFGIATQLFAIAAAAFRSGKDSSALALLVALCLGTAADLIRLIIGDLSAPYVGAGRWLLHVDQALFWVWGCSLAACSRVLFSKPLTLASLAPYVALVASGVVFHPLWWRGGWDLQLFYAIGQLMICCYGAWFFVGGRKTVRLGGTHVALTIFLGLELATIPAYFTTPFGQWWGSVIVPLYICAYTVAGICLILWPSWPTTGSASGGWRSSQGSC